MGTSIQVRLDVHNASSAPVVIRSAGVRYSVKPELTKVKTYDCIFGAGVILKNGRPYEDDPGTVLQRGERSMREGPLAITNEFGRVIEGIVEDPSLSRRACRPSGRLGAARPGVTEFAQP